VTISHVNTSPKIRMQWGYLLVVGLGTGAFYVSVFDRFTNRFTQNAQHEHFTFFHCFGHCFRIAFWAVLGPF
jgi:hypothetical protein